MGTQKNRLNETVLLSTLNNQHMFKFLSKNIIAILLSKYLLNWSYFVSSRVYSSHVHFQIEASDEKIDIEKLKVREKIHFYDDILLFEDELSDNGTSILSVKIVSIL